MKSCLTPCDISKSFKICSPMLTSLRPLVVKYHFLWNWWMKWVETSMTLALEFSVLMSKILELVYHQNNCNTCLFHTRKHRFLQLDNTEEPGSVCQSFSKSLIWCVDPSTLTVLLAWAQVLLSTFHLLLNLLWMFLMMRCFSNLKICKCRVRRHNGFRMVQKAILLKYLLHLQTVL